jgi:hypothetical protein
MGWGSTAYSDASAQIASVNPVSITMPGLDPELQFFLDVVNFFYLVNSKGSYDINGNLFVTMNYPQNPTSFLSFVVSNMLPFVNSSPSCYKITAVQV